MSTEQPTVQSWGMEALEAAQQQMQLNDAVQDRLAQASPDEIAMLMNQQGSQIQQLQDSSLEVAGSAGAAPGLSGPAAQEQLAR